MGLFSIRNLNFVKFKNNFNPIINLKGKNCTYIVSYLVPTKVIPMQESSFKSCSAVVSRIEILEDGVGSKSSQNDCAECSE